MNHVHGNRLGSQDGTNSLERRLLHSHHVLLGASEHVSVRGVIVGGRIEGTVTSRELLEIKAKGQVIGDIRTAKLTISEGGML